MCDSTSPADDDLGCDYEGFCYCEEDPHPGDSCIYYEPMDDGGY